MEDIQGVEREKSLIKKGAKDDEMRWRVIEI